ncbi:MAG TPA: EAL domain-containing protein [Steroidobacteraceae bacterium]|nr:EAL domain-containing protein [Steroidobacteraceae bacterium]
MALRTRIAVTFILLLAAVLAAALGAVSATNHSNAEREVQRQLNVGTSVFSRLLESNRRQLTQAAQAVAADYGFREAVSTRDTDTLVSVLENSGKRIGAAMVVLTTLDGEVIAASGLHVTDGAPFSLSPEQKGSLAGDGSTSLMVDNGRIYQLVTVPVRSPLPVAWIAMGFELDDKAAHELADITGLAVTLAVNSGGHWTDVVSTVPAGAARQSDVVARRIEMSKWGNAEVVAILSISLADARAPFERLTKVLFLIAAVSLIASAAAAFWLARNITRPLQDLTQAVDQMRAGTYDVALSVQRGDELGVLAEGLQLMQTAVHSRDQSIRRLAYEDSLTGLMNRTAFGAALSQALAGPRGAPIAVAVINLDRFRRINEHLGYSVGDAVLTKMAARLAAVPSVEGAVARLAADQFAAFARLRDAAGLQAWGTSLVMALAEPVFVEAQPIDITATLGLTLAADAAATADELMRCADLALEHARREKRALAIYEEALKPAARDQLSLLGELRHAVEHDELRLYFQPKIELKTGRVAGAEVLLRWQHPTRGLLGPADFIPFAEQTGFIRRLTRWTLDHAIAQGAEWQRAGKPLGLAVNISVEDVGDVRLDSRVAGMLTRHQLPPPLLTLELTESGFIEDPTRAVRVLDAVAALGVSLSIDDFGTGYSSLSHLARMPVHEVKIDRSFVQGLESDPEFASVVRSAIDMGHGLGLKVVAEGIETEESAARLRDFGCDVAQGYLYAKPMPLAAFETWLEGRERVPVIAVPVDFPAEDLTDTVSLGVY